MPRVMTDLTRAVSVPLALTLAACSHVETVRTGEEQPWQGRYDYPDARRADVVEDYHGTMVRDPYRWLEDYTEETEAWIEAENELTGAYLADIEGRDAIEARLTELWNYERVGIPFQRGGSYFYTRNDGLQNQSVLFVADALNAEPRVLIDPNTLSEDGTMSLSSYTVSPDGQYIAYGVADGGSDWQSWRVRRVDSGDDLVDHLDWIKFNQAEWAADGLGFYYARYDAPEEGVELSGQNKNQRVYYHALGTEQDDDVLVHEDPEHPEWGYACTVTEDGAYLLLSVWKGTFKENNVLIKDLRSEGSPVRTLHGDFEAQWDFVGNDGDTFYFFTDLGAPRGRVVSLDVADAEALTEVVPESEDTLRGVSYVGGHLVGDYMRDARAEIRIFATNGSLVRTVDLPGIGTASGFAGEQDENETFYSFTSFTTPSTIYRYDMATGASSVFHTSNVGFDPAEYETTQVFYASKDGTRVPMFITHRKGLVRDGNNPTLLYGYGGFNISLTPSFSVSRLVWLEMGGVLAIPNLRGGGEYGEAWYKAGTVLRKQNVFDDFIAAAEYLIDQGYTRSGRLAIQGGSNGGLLVGACMTQRPDLFGACLPAVGVMDMLRFHLFTIGWAWVSDYGSSENADEFRALYAYSPYHNLTPGVCYPPTLVTTADRDDRVVPAHSFKFAAQLQHAQACDNPVLIRIETRAGHGAGKPTSKRIEEAADLWAFLVESL
ncbi:MAG: S9 family peptidase, partial [Phycisphaerales bacterium]|nr:S9 family peptidase [Phycisphaerales bacterium]